MAVTQLWGCEIHSGAAPASCMFALRSGASPTTFLPLHLVASARAGRSTAPARRARTYAPLRAPSGPHFTQALRKKPLQTAPRTTVPPTPAPSRTPTHAPDAAAARAGETHTYEADQDGDLNLQLTMVSFADAKAKKGETYVVYAAADDGAVACVYQTPWRNG